MFKRSPVGRAIGRFLKDLFGSGGVKLFYLSVKAPAVRRYPRGRINHFNTGVPQAQTGAYNRMPLDHDL